MKRVSFIISVIVLISSITFLNSNDVFSEENSNLNGQAKKPYIEGQIIIKLKDNVDFSLQKTGPDSYSLTTDKPELNALNEKFITNAKLVFTSLMREDPATGEVTILSSRQKAEEIKQRFPQRTARAPKNAEMPELNHWLIIYLKETIRVEEAISAYQVYPDIIEYVQADYIAEFYFPPNDPYYFTSGSWGQSFDDLYGLYIINAAPAWDITTGSEDIVVAVIDGGLDYNHPDIQGNVWINQGEDLNGNGIVDLSDFDGIDNDSNGYIDDIRGWDLAGQFFGSEDNDPMDYLGHGTHCAGTIAAVGNNNIGMVGVTWNSKIMPVKGFPDVATFTFTSFLVNSIFYAANNGADVLSNSWGPAEPNYYNVLLELAVLSAHSLGGIVVFAAGNSNDNVMLYSPQNMNETITVAASDYNDQRVGFSNWGDAIDVVAPGVDILSLKATEGTLGEPVGTDYCLMSGTSMACPHVSGLIALILSCDPTLSYEEVKEILHSSADDIGAPGWDIYTGYGRINAYSALVSFAPSLIYVPQDYPTIQEAIDAAVGGQDILVSAGTYTQNISMKSGVDVIGENKNTTIIQVNWPYLPIVDFDGADDCSISGFTIRPSDQPLYSGIGMEINNSSNVSISNNIIENSYQGIRIDDYVTASIINNVIRNVGAFGITTDLSNNGAYDLHADIRNNIIENNTQGLAFDIIDGSEVYVINNVVYDNMSNGIEIRNISNDSLLMIKNNIITSNYNGIYNGGASPSLYQVNYNNVWNNTTNYYNCSAGIGSISSNPMFVNSLNENFQLGSTSPCVDAGDPNPQYNDPDGSRNDMGAYGGPYAQIPPSSLESINVFDDETYDPIQGAFVLIPFGGGGLWGINTPIFGYTNEDGLFEFNLSNPSGYIVYKSGYITVEGNISFNQNLVVFLEESQNPYQPVFSNFMME